MTTRVPFWRTRPAALTARGYWPVLSGSLAVLIGAPLAGVILGAVDKALTVEGSTAYRLCESIALVLVVSPMFSWIMLLAAVPLSIWAARKGIAGWGVAAIGGALAGVLSTVALNGRLVLHPEVFAFAGIGVFMALSYWGAIRLIHPTAIGIDVTPPKL